MVFHAVLKDEYDERGQRVSQSYFDVDERPILYKDSWAAKIVWTYDERGNRTSGSYFGVNGRSPAKSNGCRLSIPCRQSILSEAKNY
jgi:hypothetical protein